MTTTAGNYFALALVLLLGGLLGSVCIQLMLLVVHLLQTLQLDGGSVWGRIDALEGLDEWMLLRTSFD